jgi:hypothetical protein
MSLYRFLTDCWINNNYFTAGSTAYTSDVSGGLLPPDSQFVPPPQLEPMDAPATQSFFNAGKSNPAYCSAQFLIRGQFGFIAPPVTYWQRTIVPGSALAEYSLTGLGTALGSIFN